MVINKDLNGNVITIAVEGRLETTTALEREAGIVSELDCITELTFDFAKLDYISSAGLRVLLTAQKTMNRQGKMTITGANDIVMEIFDVTGFSDILNIE